jgi:V/A-type H+-transporting ATPase subunit K
MKKKMLLGIMAFASSAAAFAQTTGAAAAVSATGQVAKYVAAALAVSTAAIGGGLAVAKIGAAAVGAMAEKPELSGKALPYVGLAEGICLWGFLVAVLILFL